MTALAVRRPLAVPLLALAVAALAATAPAATALAATAPAATGDDDGAVRLELTLINGVYTDLGSQLEPIRQGPVTIRVSSPSHRLAVHGNRLSLRRVGAAGAVWAEIEVDLEGEGTLIADLEAGVTSRLEDEVIVPRQTLRLAGTIRLARVEDGFRITAVALPPSLELAIESNLLRQMVSACQGLAVVLPLDCTALAARASKASVPLPAAGTEVFLADAHLSAAERAVLAGFAEP